MEDKNKSFLKSLQEDFLEECDEYLREIEKISLSLEDPQSNREELIHELLRIIHSAKGSAMAVDFVEFSTFCHTIENFLIEVNEKEMKITHEMADLLLEVSDFFKKFVYSLKRGQQSIETNSICLKLDNKHLSLLTEDTKEQVEEKVEVEREESKENNIKLPIVKLDDLIDNFGEQVILQSNLMFYMKNIKKNEEKIHKTISQLDKISTTLQQNVMSLRMISMENFFSRMTRIVRDISRKLNKDIKFQTIGKTLKLDKAIVEGLYAPIAHLLRNAVDHGIECVENRAENKKKEVGNITLRAYNKEGFFYIEVQDDGQGLRIDEIRQRAIDKHLINQKDKLSNEQLIDLIFQSGLTTKKSTDKVSGRGIGMDVVKTEINKMRGTIEIKTNNAQGTLIKIKLPLTLSVVNGTVINEGGREFIITNSEIVEFQNVQRNSIVSVGPYESIIHLKGRSIPVINFGFIMDLNYIPDTPNTNLIIVENHGVRYAISVEKIVEQNRIVIKKLGRELNDNRTIFGATVLSGGKIALLLEIKEMINLYKKKIGQLTAHAESI